MKFHIKLKFINFIDRPHDSLFSFFFVHIDFFFNSITLLKKLGRVACKYYSPFSFRMQRTKNCAVVVKKTTWVKFPRIGPNTFVMMQCPQVYVNLNLLKIETLQGIHLIGVADMVNEYINENVKKVIKS